MLCYRWISIFDFLITLFLAFKERLSRLQSKFVDISIEITDSFMEMSSKVAFVVIRFIRLILHLEIKKEQENNKMYALVYMCAYVCVCMSVCVFFCVYTFNTPCH